MRILSIDVGIKNLGLCELEAEHGAIRLGRWAVVGGAPADGSIHSAIAGAVAAMLDAYEGSGRRGWDCVVIENQPSIKNPRMKAVQIAIHTFMIVHFGPDVSVSLAGAVGKNKIADRILASATDSRDPSVDRSTPGKRYRDAKKRSVTAARAFLARDAYHSRHLADLESSTKKDDMCDSLLQGIYFLTQKAGFTELV